MLDRTKKWTIRKNFRYVGIDNMKKNIMNLPKSVREPIVGCWITGCRASEYNALTKDMFQWMQDANGKEFLFVSGAPLRKQRKKEWVVGENGEPVYDKFGRRKYVLIHIPDATRNFPIFIDDPFVKEFGDFLFELDDRERLYNYTRQTLFKYTMKGNYRPHQLRCERAMYFVAKKNMGILFLKGWFGWASDMMPSWYVKLSPIDLVNMMYRGVL